MVLEYKKCLLRGCSYSVVAQYVEDVAQQNQRAGCESVQILSVRHFQGFSKETSARQNTASERGGSVDGLLFKSVKLCGPHTLPHCSVPEKRTGVPLCKKLQHGGSES